MAVISPFFISILSSPLPWSLGIGGEKYLLMGSDEPFHSRKINFSSKGTIRHYLTDLPNIFPVWSFSGGNVFPISFSFGGRNRFPRLRIPVERNYLLKVWNFHRRR
jgi:hypothetical protein